MSPSVIGTAPVSVVSGRALVPGLLLALGVAGLSCATASTSNGTDLAAAPAARLLFFPGDEPASGELLVGSLRAILQETGDEAELAVLAPREHPYEVGRFAVRTLPALLLVVGEEVLLRRSGDSLEDLEPWRQRVWVEAVRRGTLDAESFGTLDLELRRNLAWELLDLGRYAEAADHLAWLWRNGCRIDPAFELRRAVSLPRDLERLCESWPEGRSRVAALLAEEFERVEAGGRLWHLGSLARVLRTPEPLVAWAFRPEGREVLKRVRPEELWNLYQTLADLGALREAGRLLPDAAMALRAVDGEAERFRVQGDAAAAWTFLAWELGRLHAAFLLAGRPQEAEAVAAFVLEALGQEAGEALLLGSARSHGVSLSRIGRVHQVKRLHGGVTAAATGLYDFRNRWLEPATGAWTARDPLGDVDGLNLYSFALCLPSAVTDPSGLATEGYVRVINRDTRARLAVWGTLDYGEGSDFVLLFGVVQPGGSFYDSGMKHDVDFVSAICPPSGEASSVRISTNGGTPDEPIEVACRCLNGKLDCEKVRGPLIWGIVRRSPGCYMRPLCRTLARMLKDATAECAEGDREACRAADIARALLIDACPKAARRLSQASQPQPK